MSDKMNFRGAIELNHSLELLYLNEEIDDKTLLDSRELITFELQEHTGDLIQNYKTLDNDIEALDLLIKNYKSYQNALKKRKDRIKGIFKYGMETLGYKKLSSPYGEISFRKSTQVEIYDSKLLDRKFIEVVTEEKISKAKIKEAIKNEEDVQGAKIIEKQNLNIK